MKHIWTTHRNKLLLGSVSILGTCSYFSDQIRLNEVGFRQWNSIGLSNTNTKLNPGHHIRYPFSKIAKLRRHDNVSEKIHLNFKDGLEVDGTISFYYELTEPKNNLLEYANLNNWISHQIKQKIENTASVTKYLEFIQFRQDHVTETQLVVNEYLKTYGIEVNELYISNLVLTTNIFQDELIIALKLKAEAQKNSIEQERHLDKLNYDKICAETISDSLTPEYLKYLELRTLENLVKNNEKNNITINISPLYSISPTE